MRFPDLLRAPLALSDAVRARVRRDAGLIETTTLIAIGISLAVSAISYGIQALLAKRPPPVVGPRLDDLGAPTTNPGRNIPYAVGRNIASGQIIWSTGLIETEHKEKVGGGKGGPPATVVKSYTYSTSIALAFNDGEICGVERIIAGGSKIIWSNTLLIGLSQAEIDAQVQAKYDEVLAEETSTLSTQTDSTGGLRFTSGETQSVAERRAEIESEKLREELEAKNKDVKPRYDQIEFFFGTEDQDPSSIIEGVEGVGEVSAFRGTAYIVIENLQLADFGNFLPPIAIDYATAGTISGTADPTFTAGADDAPAFSRNDWTIVDYDRRKVFAGGVGSLRGPYTDLYEYSLDDLTFTKAHDVSGGAGGSAIFYGIDPATGYLVGNDTAANWVYDPATEAFITNFINSGPSSTDMLDEDTNHVVLIHPDGDKAVISYNTVEIRVHTFPGLTYLTTFATPDPTCIYGYPTPSTNCWHPGWIKRDRGDQSRAFGFWRSHDTVRVYQYDILSGGSVTQTQIGSFSIVEVDASGREFSFLGDRSVPHYDVATNSLIFIMGTNGPGGSGVPPAAPFRDYIVRWSLTSGKVVWSTLADLTDDGFGIGRTNTELDGQEFIYHAPGSEARRVNINTGVVTSLTLNFTYVSASHFWDGDGACLYTWNDDTVNGYALDRYCFPTVCIDDPVFISDVIDAFMTRAGFAASEYEIDSALDAETIWGFSDNAGRSSRDMLEDLSRIRPVIVNEIEGKIRFRLADQATVATIPKEDVRAYDGQTQPPEWISEIETLEDLALPRTLRINYQDIDRALNPSTAIFTREITQSTTVQEFAVQAVDTAIAMRNSVFTAMSVLLSSKRTFRLSVPLKYVVLEPGDVIVIPVSETRTARARVIRATLGANNIVELDLSLYIDTSLGIQHTDQFDRFETDTATGILDTQLYILDIPYLTDKAELNSDDEEDAGVYAAVGYQASGFRGANLYVDGTKLDTTSTFGTVTQGSGAPEWELAEQFTVSTQAGKIAKLPDPNATGLIKDITSELIVAFNTFGPSFSSLTAAQVLSSQDNVFLVGNEIIQAQTVELITSGAYAFTNLYRGLQGTEWAIGTQAINDDVVFLDPAALRRVDLGNADLRGFNIDFRAVTVGDDLTATPTTSAPFSYASRKPYAPRIVDVVRDASGNIDFVLVQRNRYGADWNPDDPAFESDPQNFEVDVIGIGSPDVVRTIAVSDTTAIAYTAAQQITDFGSAQAAVTVRPYQLSALGFRGFTNEETI